MSNNAKPETFERPTPPRNPSPPPPHPSPPPRAARRKLLGVLAILLLSALGFCALVVWQRDVRMKTVAMDWAAQTRDYLSVFYNAEGFLPARLPEELASDSHVDLGYPDASELLRLSKDPGPYIVVARRRSGLIAPGGDGCAVVIFDNGQFQARWISVADTLAAANRGRSLSLAK